MNEKAIPYDQPDLVRRVTVTGFVDTSGRFWGEDEHMARWCSCTHLRCACGDLCEKGWTACNACHEKKAVERYNALPKTEWDGQSFIYSDAHDCYFDDYDQLIDHLREIQDESPSVTVEDLRLVICKPNMAREIDGLDHFSDDLSEDGELPAELDAALETLNAVIRKTPPLSWSPGKEAAIVEIDPKDLADAA